MKAAVLSDGTEVYVSFHVEYRRKALPVTSCVVSVKMTGTTEIHAVGVSKCGPRDQYNKVMGKAIAMRRALWKMYFCFHLDRPTRKQIWATFYRTFKDHPDVRVLSGFRCDAKVEA